MSCQNSSLENETIYDLWETKDPAIRVIRKKVYQGAQQRTLSETILTESSSREKLKYIYIYVYIVYNIENRER